MAFLLLPASGCRPGAGEGQESSVIRQSRAVTNHLEPELDGGRYCVETMTKGPAVAAPIHFSHKQSSSDGSAKDYEADLSAQTFDLTIRYRYLAEPELLRDLPHTPPVHDGFADSVRTHHYTRADTAGWSIAGRNVVLAATPWGLFVANPPATRVGTENIQGYETIKYAVDTTHQSQTDKSGAIQGSNLMGGNLKDYNIIGTVWATRDTGCILQYFIDSEKVYSDGTSSQDHYEGTITKQ